MTKRYNNMRPQKLETIQATEDFPHSLQSCNGGSTFAPSCPNPYSEMSCRRFHFTFHLIEQSVLSKRCRGGKKV
jgi:hypothetical protein